MSVEGRQVEEAMLAVLHTVLLHRSTGKFHYKKEGTYSIGTVGTQDVDCDFIDFTYVRVSSEELDRALRKVVGEFKVGVQPGGWQGVLRPAEPPWVLRSGSSVPGNRAFSAPCGEDGCGRHGEEAGPTCQGGGAGGPCSSDVGGPTVIVAPMGRAFRLLLFPSAIWVSPGRSPEQEACWAQVTALWWPVGRVAQVCMCPPLWAWRRVRGTLLLWVLVTSGGVRLIFYWVFMQGCRVALFP